MPVLRPAIATLALFLLACGSPTPELSHGGDVDTSMAWRDWTERSFADARREGRLILVSVQASWCHWCHVMNDTTYTDPRVVALLREHFVTIRVDSDARPDLAERYARWAWPATAILTPDARPVTELRGHQPARRFERLLRELVGELEAGRPIGRREAPEVMPDPALADLAALRDVVVAQLDGFYDARAGGWGRPQKYPYAAPVEHALFRARVHGEDTRLARALETLDGHAALIDPVWGGVYQYSLRGDWEHPHYEKIAAIQAGAIRTFADAFRATGDPRWAEEAERVRRYVTEFLTDPSGGFYTSQDADFGEHGTDGAIPGDRFYALGDTERRALGAPRVDRGIYANLNGMMISAFVALYQATGDEGVLRQAEAAARRILETHRVGDAFTHGPAADETSTIVHLGDQVEMARALLALHEATGRGELLAEARRTMDFVRRDLGDPDRGGFFAHTADPTAVGVFAERRKPLVDNAIAARVLMRLSRIDGYPALREEAARALRSVADRAFIREHGRKVGEYALALEEIAAGYAILSVVGPDVPRTRALHRSALRYFHPLRIVELGRPNRSRYPYPGEPAVYLCTKDACSLPISDPEHLDERADEFIDG